MLEKYENLLLIFDILIIPINVLSADQEHFLSAEENFNNYSTYLCVLLFIELGEKLLFNRFQMYRQI